MRTQEEDKVALTHKRAELISRLAGQLSPTDRVHLQGELSVLNARIKAINTTTAAQLKADADRRRVAGLAEAQANAARARANAGLSSQEDPPHHYRDDLACPACGTDSTAGCIAGASEDDDPGQTAAVEGWIDAVLLRNDIDFARDAKGALRVTSDPKQKASLAPNLEAAIEMLAAGVLAAARGQELPDLPPSKASKAAKPKPKKR